MPPSILDQVVELGELRVVTRDSPTTYFVGPDGPAGLEYDLAKSFADKLGVELIIETFDNVAEIVPYLSSGKAHLAAAGLSMTNARREFLGFGHPYNSVDMHLIYKLGSGKPREIADLIGRSIEITADSSHSTMMQSLNVTYPGLKWSENANDEVADLLKKVALGKVNYTIADSTEFGIQRHFYPDLRVAMDLKINNPITWAFPNNADDSLLARADEFMINANRSGLLAQVTDRYFGHTEKFDYVGTRAFIRHFDSRLPRFEEMFKDAGTAWGVDWRLLAAAGYQESHWRSHAVSPTGVRGIMMLTQATASYLGVSDRLDPETSIFGGARFLARQLERLPDSVEEPDRTWFALAAYNVGFNHIKDARQIVEWQGGDPNKWVNLSEALPLLSKRVWYARLPHGYARGWEPVRYVKNIRAYYNIIRWLTENEDLETIDETSDGPGLIALSSEND